jgi:ribosomal protein S18 acetylase RimI-like enzyme
MACIDLQPEDAERLYAFYRSLTEEVTATFQPFREVSLDVMRRHLDEAQSGRHVSIGLEKSAEIVGHCFVTGIDEKHPVFGIGIQAPFHGRGLGRRLMAAAIEKAHELGAAHITLTVLKRNKKAISMYKSFGFKIIADHSFQEENDSYLMTCGEYAI